MTGIVDESGATSTARAALGMIRAVTLTAPDLDRVEQGYVDIFGYSRVARRQITTAEAQSWGAPASAGRDMLRLRPASGANTELRFIQWTMPDDHRPFATWGWNALEIIVRDPDALARRIDASDAFTLKTAPHGIDTFPYLRACQAVGPAGEYLNLTRIDPPQPDLPVAEAFVDRCFIVTLGARSIDELRAFYGAGFANQTSEPRRVRLRMMNRLCGLDEETKHPLSTVRLAGGTKLELDECPEMCGPRAQADGGLPWGIGMVSFDCTAIAPYAAKALGPVLEEKGERRLTIEGPGGERVELVESMPG